MNRRFDRSLAHFWLIGVQLAVSGDHVWRIGDQEMEEQTVAVVWSTVVICRPMAYNLRIPLARSAACIA